MKKILIILILSAVMITGGYFWLHNRADVETGTPQWSTAQVEKGPIRVAVSCTGPVVPNLDVEIKCKASGEVVKLPVDISDKVKKGDLLVELDPVDEQRKLKQAEISLASSQARLRQKRVDLGVAENELEVERKRTGAALKSAEACSKDARAKAKRVRQLFEKKLASQEDKETAETAAIEAEVDLENVRIRMEELPIKEQELEIKRQDVKLAEAQVETDKINLSLAEQCLKDTKVFSPIDGVVSERNVQIGQIISSGISNVGGGTRVMVISDIIRLFVLASVDESDIGKVEVEQKVIITADAFPGRGFLGKVERIAAKGIEISNVVTFEVKIEVLGKDRSLLKPGMTANVEIIVAEKEKVLLVPSEAVLRKKREHVVRVMKDDGSVEERFVQTGISDGVVTEIISGLIQGEIVAYRRGEARSRWRTDRSRRSLTSGREMRMMMGR
jgi:HlyD family secretion protein